MSGYERNGLNSQPPLFINQGSDRCRWVEKCSELSGEAANCEEWRGIYSYEKMTRVKVSAAWLKKELNCSAEGIKLCGGRCCRTKGFYPPKCSPDFVCPHLTETGCKFSREDKPLKCLLYPLVLQKRVDGSIALNLHHRAPCSICKECYKQGSKSIVRQQEDNLKEIFGDKIVDEMIEAIESGQDYIFELPKQVERQLDFEEKEEKENKEPVPRSIYNI